MPQERGAPALMGGRTPLPTSWAAQKAPPASAQSPTATAQAKFSPFPASAAENPAEIMGCRHSPSAVTLQSTAALPSAGVIYSTAHVPCPIPVTDSPQEATQAWDTGVAVALSLPGSWGAGGAGSCPPSHGTAKGRCGGATLLSPTPWQQPHTGLHWRAT